MSNVGEIRGKNYLEKWGRLEPVDWVTSDLHFGDELICRHLRNQSIEENLESIRKNWNSLVAPRDNVYVLGDMFGENVDPSWIANYLWHHEEPLNGNIKLVGGNHDHFEKISESNDFGYGKLEYLSGAVVKNGYILTHIPIHPGELKLFKGNIHGHLHRPGFIDGLGDYQPYDPGEGYINVNIELWDYKPIRLDLLIKED